jgi:hypothetical protein
MVATRRKAGNNRKYSAIEKRVFSALHWFGKRDGFSESIGSKICWESCSTPLSVSRAWVLEP